MLWKCCTQDASKFGKLSSGQRTGKGQCSFQSQRKAMPRNVQTTAQLHSSHKLASSVQFSHSVMSDTLQLQESHHTRLSCPSATPRVCPNSCPLSWWWHLAISSSVVPSLPTFNPSQRQGLFQWVDSLHEVAKVLEFQLQHQSFQWTPRTDLL